jgi:tetratricopeptide (TPR) repeat protein
VALDQIMEASAKAQSLSWSSPQRLQWSLALVAVLADLGRLPEAFEAAEDVRLLRLEVESAHLRGTAAWVLGNIAFLAGDVALGNAEHREARQLLRPEADLLLWGRFHKASARLRVASGDRDVAELIDEADHALRLAGKDGDLRELDLVRAELALDEGDPERTLVLVERAVNGSLPPNTRGEAETLRHRALLALGREDEAAAALTRAALLFEEAGAYRRALDAWRTNAGVPRTD